jgi:hypothetical protein
MIVVVALTIWAMPLSIRGLVRVVVVAVVLAAFASPASAQFQRRDPTIGERYHVEASGVFWSATPDLIISSESLGIPGDDVNLVTDLGIAAKRLRELRLVLRPATKHKFRFNYTPIKYDAQSAVTREFVFNGQRYRPGILVATTADLTTMRFGYEYDFLYTDRGYAGVLLDVKYTNIDVGLNSPIGDEFMKSVAPIPTVGFAGRGYVVPNISITGEVTFFKVPENLGGEDYGGRYVDFDIYGTFNFNENVGAQLGYRSIDVNYFADLDAGTLTFKGLYFGGVVRF